MTNKKEAPKKKRAKAETIVEREARLAASAPPAAEIDAGAFERATAEADSRNAAAPEPSLETAASALGAMLDAEETKGNEAPGFSGDIPANDIGVASALDIPPVAEGAPADKPRKGGWPKGKPRGPRSHDGAGAARTPLSAPVEGDPVRRLRGVERENAELRAEVATLRVRTDEQTHRYIKSGIGALIVMAGNMAARKYGDHMKVGADEANEVGGHVGNALIPFHGDYSKYMPLVVAAGAVASVMIPRAQIEQEILEGKRPRIMNGVAIATVV